MGQIGVFCIDINEYYSQLCYYKKEEESPVSVSVAVGSEDYLIPTVVAKEPSVSRWYVGEEALFREEFITGFLEKAYRKETITVQGEEVPAVSLLELYIRRLLSRFHAAGVDKQKDRFVFCVEHANKLARETFFGICEELEIPREHVTVSDKKEALCYYMMKQEPSLRMYDVMILDYWEKQIHVYLMHTDRHVSPQVVSVEDMVVPSPEKEDEAFYNLLDELLAKKTLSAVYLVGQGFEGDWMKRSLNRLCTGRRVFFGMNLYAKGACYYGATKDVNEPENLSFVYLGGGNVLSNVCLSVIHQEQVKDIILIQAGMHWQDAVGSAEVILKGELREPELEISIYPLKKGEKRVELLPLSNLIVEKDTLTRLKVTAKAVSHREFSVKVRETGFGELFHGQNKEFEFTFAF